MSDVKFAIPIEVLRKVKFEKVPEEYADKPVYADNNAILEKIKPKLRIPYKNLTRPQKLYWKEIKEEYNKVREEALQKDEFKLFREYISNNIMRYLRRLDVQDMMRINSSTIISLGDKFNKLEHKLRPAWLFRKIELSSWHWGKYKSASYNECVDVYNSITKFDMGIEGFSVEVDTSSSWCNEKGYSKYTRTFLDAELAYIIRYKGKHVLTVSFNAILGGDKTIQIRQIQCKNKKGNRWMYKLPKNYIEFIVDKFFEIFQGYDIYMIRAATAVNEISESYLKIVERELHYFPKSENTSPESKQRAEKSLDEALYVLYKFDSVDAPRMKSIYGKRLSGYRRVSMDSDGKCSLLKRA